VSSNFWSASGSGMPRESHGRAASGTDNYECVRLKSHYGQGTGMLMLTAVSQVDYLAVLTHDGER